MLDKPMSPQDFATHLGSIVNAATKKDEEGNATEAIDHEVFVPAVLRLFADQIHGLTNAYATTMEALDKKQDKSTIIMPGEF